MADKAKTTSKETLEDALRKRCESPDAMRAGISTAGGEIRIVFGGVEGHARMSLLIKGDTATIERS